MRSLSLTRVLKIAIRVLIVLVILTSNISEHVSTKNASNSGGRNTCGRYFPRNRNRISGGLLSEPGWAPSYVHIKIQESPNVISECNGALISNIHILTVARCVAKEYLKVCVWFGVNRTDSTAESLNNCRLVAETCLSTNYNSKKRGNDYALLRLEEPVIFDRQIQPACLPQKPSYRNQSLLVFGMGSTTEQGQEQKFPEKLQFLRVKRLACRSPNRHPSLVCVTSYEKDHLGDICAGDLGSPLVGLVNDRQVVYGVAVSASGDCRVGGRGGYESVYSNIYYLRDKIRGLLSKCKLMETPW